MSSADDSLRRITFLPMGTVISTTLRSSFSFLILTSISVSGQRYLPMVSVFFSILWVIAGLTDMLRACIVSFIFPMGSFQICDT